MSFNFIFDSDSVLGVISQAGERALETIGLYVEGEAKLRCPVDTGNLRSSIDHVVDSADKSVTIGTNIEYSIYVEKGTSRQRAQPYLTPAIEENQRNIQAIVEQELGNI